MKNNCRRVSLTIWIFLLFFMHSGLFLWSQLPEFMNRLAGGKIAGKDFKESIDFELVAGRICIKRRELKRNIRTFGFTYGYEKDALRVRSLYGGSQAEKLGMQIGNQIYSINGASVENLTEDQILRFRKGDLIFSRDEDESITLEVQISGKKARIKLAAYDLFAK